MEATMIYLAAAVFAFGILIAIDGLTRRHRPVKARRTAAELFASGSTRALWAATGAAAGAGAAWVLTHWVSFALVAGVVGALAPGVIVQARAARQRLARQEALAQVADRLRNAVRAGTDLKEALLRAADAAPAALRDEMAYLTDLVRRRGVREALEALADATEDPFTERFARVLAGAYQGGGRLGTLLGAISEAAYLETRTAQEVRTRQTQLRMAANILAAIPVLLVLYLKATNPVFLSAYGTVTGQLIMLVGFSLIAAGWWLGRSLARLRS
jgi:tight adherence protein B